MSDIERVLQLLRRGNTLAALRGLSQAEGGSHPLADLNRELYGRAGEGWELVEAQISRHLQGLASAPQDEKALLSYNLGCFALAQEDVFTAKLRFAESAQMRPGFAAALHNLGYTHELMTEFPEAEAAYREALAADADCALTRLNLALVYLAQGERDRALQQLRELQAADAKNQGALLFLCRTLLRRPDVENATEVKALLDAQPGWEEFLELRECRGFSLLLLGESDGAEVEFRAVLERDDTRRFARVGLIKVLAAKKDFTNLLREADRLTELEPAPEVERLTGELQRL